MDKGFSLIELLIVVGIIALLSAIAYPSYQEYVIKSKRVEVQSEMIRIAQRLQAYKVVNQNYKDVTLDLVDATNSFPTNKPNYSFELTDANGKDLSDSSANVQTWLLVATPIANTTQIDNGHIVINHLGYKCWVKGSDKNSGTACNPSAITNWGN